MLSSITLNEFFSKIQGSILHAVVVPLLGNRGLEKAIAELRCSRDLKFSRHELNYKITLQISFNKVHAFLTEEVEEVYDDIWYKNVTSAFNRPISSKNTEQETSTRNIYLPKDPACHSFEGADNIPLIIKNSVMP